MEPLRIRVESLNVKPDVTHAVVSAISAKRTIDEPEVHMMIVVSVPTVPHESHRMALLRVRDVALAYLDPE
jgi:hypothetical protein